LFNLPDTLRVKKRR